MAKNVLKATGCCLCGAIEMVATTVNPKIGTCHCSTCRQWTGGPLFAADCGTAVEFKGEEKISIFSSSEWAERGFCSTCGTHLFYRLKENNRYFIPVGLLKDSEAFIFDHQVFIEEKPDLYSFANQTLNMTGAELFAQFSDE